MNQFPNFMSILGSVPIASIRTVAGAASTSNTLLFTMVRQTETNWCWAAVSTSVSHFFNHSSTWTQCLVANAAWSRSDCCGSGASNACNKPWYLDRALTIVRVFDRMIARSELFSTVQNEINSGRPLCIRIGWSSGGGHFLSIYGWQITPSGAEFYYVDDPIYGSQRIARRKLESLYQGSGRWTHSYYVQDSTLARSNPLEESFPQALGA